MPGMTALCRLKKLQKQVVVAQVPPAASAGVGTELVHPNDVELNSRLEATVLKLRQSERPKNTLLAIDTKILEYFQFCEYAFPHQRYREVLSYEKVYRFMFYQSFRPQKKKGGTKKLLEDGCRFDKEVYERVALRQKQQL